MRFSRVALLALVAWLACAASAAAQFGENSASNVVVGPNLTSRQSFSPGNRVIRVLTETTGGFGSRPVGAVWNTSDDRAAVYFAVREVQTVPLTVVKTTHRSRVFAASTTLAITVENEGALLVLNAAVYHSGQTAAVTVSDNVDGSWTEMDSACADADSCVWQFYLNGSTAGSKTITFDPAGASATDIEFWVTEVIGQAPTNVLDSQSGSATGSYSGIDQVTPTVTTASTLAQARNIVFVAFTHTGASRGMSTGTIGGVTATQIGESEDNDDGQSIHVQYRIIDSDAQLTSTGILEPLGQNPGGSYAWAILQGVYKEAEGAEPPPPPPAGTRLLLLGVGR